MKTNFIFLICVLGLMGLSSCQPTAPSGSNSSSGSGEGGGGGGTGTTGGTTGGTGSTGGGGSSTCAGDSSDGKGDGYSLHHFDLLLAGHQTWAPGTYSASLATQTMPTIQEAKILFQSDSRLKVRFKVNSQPYPTAGEEYCHGRSTHLTSDVNSYGKLRLRARLRNIMCDTPDPNNTNNCLSGFYLGSAYATKLLQPIAVDGCSPVIDFGPLRSVSPYGTVVEVDDVKSDQTCEANGSYCPAEKIVRSASCWHMTMQVSTDYTQDFK